MASCLIRCPPRFRSWTTIVCTFYECPGGFIWNFYGSSPTEVLMYADDCKLLREITSEEDASALQRDITSFSKWCQSWSLRVNPNKCSVLTVSLKKGIVQNTYNLCDLEISRVSSQNDLGIITDSKLNFSEHVDYIVKRSMKMLGLLYRYTEMRNPTALVTFLKSYHTYY